MINFLIQTINNEIKHDFSFSLIESINYQNWIQNDKVFDFIKTNDISFYNNYVPVGSVEFVVDYLSNFYNKCPKPRNIPECLLIPEFTKRKIFNGTEEDIKNGMFFKSSDKIKGEIGIKSHNYLPPEGNYQISEFVDILSEYRVFMYNKKIVGIKHYSGDFFIFPDVNIIQKMVNSFENAPIAYTLDIGIIKEGTCIIEVHDFFSCGLYGFSDHKILPYMLYKWFFEFIKEK